MEENRKLTPEERRRFKHGEVESLMEVAYPKKHEEKTTHRTLGVESKAVIKDIEPPPGRKPLIPRVYDYW